MIKNYFKTAFRNLLSHRNYTVINIAGLAAGIGVCLMIFLVIQFEMSFDNFHSKKDRIYRVLTEYHHADAAEVFYGPGLPSALPRTLPLDFPQIEKTAPIYTEGNDQILVLNENGVPVKKFKERHGVFFTTPAFFDILDFPLIAGDKSTSLKDPNTAIVTKEIAEKYFGDWKEAIGKTIKWNNAEVLKITGVLATIPANTDFQLKVVVSMGTGETARFATSDNWSGSSSAFGCYILLPPNVSASDFNRQLAAFSRRHLPADAKDLHVIQPIEKVHFDSKVGNYSGKTISPELIRALWMIAAFIMLIACVNFINLSTAQAVNRAKEVGVRKVLGSNKFQLRWQFIIETFLLVLGSAIIASALNLVALPVMSKILDLPLSFAMLNNPIVWSFLLATIILVTLLAGFYPSLVLSGFNPINALKSKLSAGSTKGLSLRRGLVVFQFIIAQALIIGTLIIVKQMNYFTTQQLGFDKDAIINVPFPGDSAGTSKLDFLRKKLSDINGIQSISFSSNTPTEDDNDNWSTFNYDHALKETDFFAIIKWSDNNYLPTYKMQLVAGRNVQPSDTCREFLVNESLIKKLGVRNPEEALNKQISLWDGYLKGTIVGVMKEFHSRSFRRDLAPVLMTTWKRNYSQAGLKLATTDISSTIKAIEKTWETVYPDFVFEYQFLDAKIENFYEQENRLSDLYKMFAAIAILLSCLGLYGLASFMAVQRIKEVGIRKVLGATASSIVYIFSKEFIALIAIAFVIATPLAWLFMHKWLQDYPYRINMSWWIFVSGGIGSLLLALLTVSFQAIRAALSNPVKSLRSE